MTNTNPLWLATRAMAVFAVGVIAGCGGGGGGSAAGPSISSLYPNVVVSGHYDATISVLGANFQLGSTVTINGTSVPTRYFSSGKLRVYFMGYTFPNAGSAQVVVTNPGASSSSGGGTSSVAAALTFASPNYTLTTIAATPSAMVWNSTAGVFYFLTYSNASSNTNTIGVLDPGTNSVTYTALATGSPQSLAISDDNLYLYLYSSASTTIQRFLLPSLTPDITITAEGNAFDVEPAPGASRTIAVSYNNEHGYSSNVEIAIYDDAVARAETVPFGTTVQTPYLAWGADASTLYGLESDSSAGTLEYFSVSAGGVAWIKSHNYPTPISASGISYDRNQKLLYLGNSLDDTQIIDPAADYWAGRTDSPGLAVPDSTTSKVFQAFYTDGPNDYSPETTIASFDQVTHDYIEAISFLPGAAGTPPRPIRYGSNGLAIMGGAGIQLLTGDFVNNRPAAPTGGPDGPVSSTVNGQRVLVVDVQATDVAADPTTGHLFVSRGGYDRAAPNTLAEIDPNTGTIVQSIAANTDPGALSVSGDGQYLYVANIGAAAVDRYTLPGLAADYHYPLGWNEALGWEFGSGPFLPMDLKVAPGAAQTLAVQMASSIWLVGGVSPTQQGGIVILDNNVPRPTQMINWPTGGPHDSIQWGATADVLYACNNESISNFEFLWMTVDSAGVHANGGSSFAAAPYANIYYDASGNRIFSDAGLVIDAANGTQVGTLGALGSVAAVMDSANNRGFFLVGGANGGVTIQAYDLQTLASVGSLDLPFVAAYPSRLVRWGSNGLAFNGADGELWIISGSFVH